MPEPCGVCGEAVAIRHAVHVTIHTKGDAGVVDHYVCKPCYEAEVAPAFESPDASTPES